MATSQPVEEVCHSWRSDSSLDYHMNILAIGNNTEAYDYNNDDAIMKGLNRYYYSDDGFPSSTQESFRSEC